MNTPEIILSNLCEETLIGPVMECTLTPPDIYEFLLTMTDVHRTQVLGELYRRGGGPENKIINSFYSGATPEQRLDYGVVKRITDIVMEHCADDPTKAAKVVSEVQNIYYEAFNQELVSMVMLRNLFDQGHLPQMAKLFKGVIEQDKIDSEQYQQLLQLTIKATKAKQMDPITKTVDETEYLLATETNSKRLLDSIQQLKEDKVVTPAGPTFVNPKYTKFDTNGNVITKRKKSKPKSNHLPNMGNKTVKRAMGATILGMLGQVQRDTQDAQKRALLKELPAADVIELATGNKLPDYQANLINAAQAKADPEAPIVKRMGELYKDEYID